MADQGLDDRLTPIIALTCAGSSDAASEVSLVLLRRACLPLNRCSRDAAMRWGLEPAERLSLDLREQSLSVVGYHLPVIAIFALLR